jgi:hypothetical protein
MNHLIKSFALKSGAVEIDNTVNISTMDIEQFASMIIQECAEVAGCNGHVSGFSLGDMIQEHFTPGS